MAAKFLITMAKLLKEKTPSERKKMMRKVSVCKLARVRKKKRKEDELFLAGLIIPTLLFSMASLLSTYNFAHNTMCHPATFFSLSSLPSPTINAHKHQEQMHTPVYSHIFA